MTKQEQNLLGDIISQLIESNISVRLENTSTVKCDGVFCEGFFSDVDKELVVAFKQSTENFVLVFVHEFCHYLQWKEKSKIYRKADPYIPTLDKYIAGKIKRSKRTDTAAELVQTMELECEKKTIQLIKDYQIPYNIENCIRKSNSYIYFYSILKSTRKWYTVSPTTVPKIIDQMPATFLNDYSIVSPQLMTLYEKCYY